MKQSDYEIARKLKERLTEVIFLLDFRVFGSRAREDADEYSDMDVFIEVESADRTVRERISDIAWEVGLENSVVIFPLVFSRHEVEESPLRESPILKNVAEEGVAV